MVQGLMFVLLLLVRPKMIELLQYAKFNKDLLWAICKLIMLYLYFIPLININLLLSVIVLMFLSGIYNPILIILIITVFKTDMG